MKSKSTAGADANTEYEGNAPSGGSSTPGIIIPREKIPAEVLQKIIESFVLEEGTDYGQREYSLESKVQAVIKQLERGELELVFDPESEVCSLRRR